MQGGILRVESIEGTCSSVGHALGFAVHIAQFTAVGECTLSNARHVRGEGDAVEVATLIESIVRNTRQLRILGNIDGGEAAASQEGMVSNTRHVLGDSEAGKATAIRESLFSNARHTLRYGDGGEAAATRENIASNR